MKIWPIFLLTLTVVAEAGEARVRPAAMAGTWYPAEAKVLRKQIEGYFAKAPKAELGGPPVALISPHAGYRFSGRCAGAAYAQLRGCDIRRVILMGPSHHLRFHGGSIPKVDFYQTPLGRIPLDRAVCDAVLKSPLVRTVPGAHSEEHSLELQLPFLQVALKKFSLVPIVLGSLKEKEHSELGKILRRHVDAHTLVVASSDFTHYGRRFGFTPFQKNLRANIEKLDKGAVEHILKVDPSGFRKYVSETGATICGRVPISVMLEMLTPDCRGKLLEYYMSGDLNNDYSHSVSYAACVFSIGPGEVGAAGRKRLLEVARQTLRAVLNGEPPPEFDIQNKDLQVERGVFVTYKNKGRLRGCIGRFVPHQPLWKLAGEMAVAAAHDRRFVGDPITSEEEPEIGIQISVLSPMVRVKDPLNFVPGIHGLYIRRGRRTGTYLPQVATEQGWDRRTFISHLCRRKIGIAPDAWKDDETQVYIYSAQVFGDSTEK